MKYDYTDVLKIGIPKNREFQKISLCFSEQETFLISYPENDPKCHDLSRYRILFSKYVKACESFGKLMALILSYSESISTFIMGWRGDGTLGFDAC